MKKFYLQILIVFSVSVLSSIIANGQSNLSSITFLKSAKKYIGQDKSYIITAIGSHYSELDLDEGIGMLYSPGFSNSYSPKSVAFISQYNDVICQSVAIYYSYNQLNKILSYMNKNFKSIYPPSGAQVSFYKAWAESYRGNLYIWKLTKTDNLFFLTLRQLQ